MKNTACRWKSIEGNPDLEYECRRGTIKGATFCPEHQARIPFWPQNEQQEQRS